MGLDFSFWFPALWTAFAAICTFLALAVASLGYAKPDVVSPARFILPQVERQDASRT
jgi:hypothetical protein